jgi:hypothetical protein
VRVFNCGATFRSAAVGGKVNRFRYYCKVML